MVSVGGLIVIVFYFVLLLFIGAAASAKIKTSSDYLVAGRTLGFWMFVMLVLGSVVSGMTLLGVAGLGSTGGWPTFWEQLFVPLTCGVMIILYGYKIYQVCQKNNFHTVQDYLAYRFESPKAVRSIASLAVVVTSLIYLVGQYDAISIVLRSILNITQIQALLLGVFIVVIYVLLGGLYAVAWTNLFQGIIIIIGVLIMAPLVINAAGGLTVINQTLAAKDPNLVQIAFPQAPPYAKYAVFTPLFIISWFFLLAFGLGSAPHIINNVIAVKDKKLFRWSPLVIVGLYLIIMYLIKITGMAVGTLVETGKLTLTRPDDAFIAGVRYAMPSEFVWSFFAVVVLAAVMSTTDRLLLVIGSAFGWDFYKQLFNKDATHKQITLVSRIAVLVFGTISFVLALMRTDQLLAWLIWMGIGIMLSTFVTPILFGLYWKGATKQGAIWSMIAGFVSAFIFGGIHQWVKKLPMHYSFYSFVISIVVMLVVSLLTKKPSKELLDASLTGGFIRGKNNQ
ncbi:MAG: sodium:solute symporter family protein [bacterium]|nr:sodium:solute symporter family protein [bacterium]